MREVACEGGPSRYDGNMDLYTLPVTGGVPFRVTYHPGFERLSDWTADGRLIFSSSMYSAIGRASKLFLQDAVYLSQKFDQRAQVGRESGAQDCRERFVCRVDMFDRLPHRLGG